MLKAMHTCIHIVSLDTSKFISPEIYKSSSGHKPPV